MGGRGVLKCGCTGKTIAARAVRSAVFYWRRYDVRHLPVTLYIYNLLLYDLHQSVYKLLRMKVIFCTHGTHTQYAMHYAHKIVLRWNAPRMFTVNGAFHLCTVKVCY